MSRSTILVSNTGECYCVCESNKRVRWSYQMKPAATYKADQDVGAKRFVFAKQNADGDIKIWCNISSSKAVDISKNTDEHLEDIFKGRVSYHRIPTVVRYSPKLGREVEVDDKNHPTDVNVVEITRIRYTMIAPDWRFDCSTYRCLEKGFYLPVRHSLSEGDFIRQCEKIKDYTFADGSSMKDVLLRLKLKNLNEIRIPSSIPSPIPKLVNGKYNGHRASIQLIDDSNISKRYDTMMKFRASPHKNILSFHGAEIDKGGNFLFAFEDYNYNLVEYMRMMRRRKAEVDDTWLMMLRGVVEGLRYIHSHDLSYGRLSPWNVLISGDQTTKLFGVDKCSKLTRRSRESDILDLALFLGYCFSDLDITEDSYRSMDENKILKYIGSKEREAADAVKLLIKYRNDEDILEVLLKHPIFWSALTRMTFFKDSHEVISLKGSPVSHTAIDGLHVWSGSNWRWKFEPELIRVTKGTFDYTSVVGLIRFIRNVYSHQLEIGRKLSKKSCGNYIGYTTSNLEFQIRRTFPSLLVKLYHELERQNKHLGTLQHYYS